MVALDELAGDGGGADQRAVVLLALEDCLFLQVVEAGPGITWSSGNRSGGARCCSGGWW